MQAVRFEQSFTYETIYRCSIEGDQSGLYVPAEVAERLATALNNLLTECEQYRNFHPQATLLVEGRAAIDAAESAAWVVLFNTEYAAPAHVPEDNNPCR